jgi:hypothetical protein
VGKGSNRCFHASCSLDLRTLTSSVGYRYAGWVDFNESAKDTDCVRFAAGTRQLRPNSRSLQYSIDVVNIFSKDPYGLVPLVNQIRGLSGRCRSS